MPRTLGKISLAGKDLTDFVPVKCNVTLGTVTGHMTVPLHFEVDAKERGYVLQLKGSRSVGISFSGMFGPRAYFHTVGFPGIQ